MTVLAVLWAEPVIALPVIHSVAMVTDTAHIPGSLSLSTIHRTLPENTHLRNYNSSNMLTHMLSVTNKRNHAAIRDFLI